jgi:hypothetical protein
MRVISAAMTAALPLFALSLAINVVYRISNGIGDLDLGNAGLG